MTNNCTSSGDAAEHEHVEARQRLQRPDSAGPRQGQRERDGAAEHDRQRPNLQRQRQGGEQSAEGRGEKIEIHLRRSRAG